MASFHEVRFPLDLAYGTKGGPRFSTSHVKLRSGAGERVAHWSYPLHAYNVKYALRGYSDLVTVRDFWIRRLGPAHGFRFKDILDYSTEAGLSGEDMFRAYDHTGGAEPWTAPAWDDVEIGTGDGTTKVFQLAKKYVDGIVTRTRTISKPISGTVKSGLDAAEQTEGTDWTVDTTTGKITYTTAPTNGQSVKAGCEFDVPVHFSEEVDEDAFGITLSDFGGGSAPDIELFEEFLGGQTSDEFFFGGAGNFDSLAADISVTLLSGRVLRLVPTVAGVEVALPDTTDIEPGGPHFFVVNDGATDSVTLTDSAGISVGTVAAQDGATVVLSVPSAGSKVWKVF